MTTTYYDILGVRPDADAVEIKRAYRRLASKYHPDKYSDESLHSDATAAMAVINNVNAVLSDSESRARYDEFLLQRATLSAFDDNASSNSSKKSDHGAFTNNASSSPSNSPASAERVPKSAHLLVYSILGCFVVIALSIVVAVQWADYSRRSLQEASPLVAPSSSFDDLRGTPPFGTLWPTHASYFDEAPTMRESGRSSVVVSNEGRGDLYVKLYWSYHADGSLAVRHLFLPAHQSFTMERVSAGLYELRVLNLKSRRAFKSVELRMADKDRGTLYEYKLNLWDDNVVPGMSEIDLRQF